MTVRINLDDKNSKICVSVLLALRSYLGGFSREGRVQVGGFGVLTSRSG
jgi:hypothetical protein